MISSIDELRRTAVRHILRKTHGSYLLRHALGKPWYASTQQEDMAWTDFRNLFFNFPLLQRTLMEYTNRIQRPLHPSETTTAILAALSHEILHVLWLHNHRGVGKHREAWRVACEWAINYHLGFIFGVDWITHLGVMYPNPDVLKKMRARDLPYTTDGFYTLLDEEGGNIPVLRACTFCERCETTPAPAPSAQDQLRMVLQLPDSDEKAELLSHLTAQKVPEQKLPWETLLLGGIEDAVEQEQSWAKPSRYNEQLPGWRHRKMLSFVWILDVSPSIDDQMKQSFVNTLQAGINLYHDAQHRVIFFADGIEQDFVVSSGTDLSRMRIPSGNGTCLKEVWKVLERDRPEYALVLTDLELAPVPKPSVTRIIWGIVGNYRAFDPDYGTQIELR